MNHLDTKRRWKVVHWAIILLATVCSFWGALNPFSGDTANSRMATVYALVHYGSWEIGNPDHPNPLEGGTIDKVRVEGKLYSSKPPVMPLLMAAQYWALHRIVGYDLRQESDRKPVLRILIATCVSLPFLLSGVAFYFLLGIWRIKPWVKAVGLSAARSKLPAASPIKAGALWWRPMVGSVFISFNAPAPSIFNCRCTQKIH